MEEMNSEKKIISKKIIIFLSIWVVFALSTFIFPELMITCPGRLIFGIMSSLMILAMHLFLREERDTAAKRYFWYAMLIMLLWILGFWFHETLSDCYLIGSP
ncbi:MAG: hypothetical protein HXS40_12470 [Theionarchaea archaeon]|nr:hypothetical protein [Theionarchaea archaeon]